MQPFEFYNPTRIVFGEEQIASLDQLIATDQRVLILYGGGSAERNGTLAQVRAALGERFFREFGAIEPNPQFDTLMKAVAQVKADNIDFLLAVGGGSVIDGAKFIAAAACFAGDPWEILLERGSNIEAALPLGTVLTLPATGSEMNNGAVVTRAQLNAKLPLRNERLFPVFSILDPSKTLTLPPRQVANGIVDAYVHVLEQYLTYPAQAAVQDRFAESLLTILLEQGPLALSNPEDINVRANLMWVASMALNGLIGAGVPQDWSSHMIGHELTALYGIDHARTLAIVLPGVWQVCRQDKAAKLLQYGERVLGISQGSEAERITAAIEQTEQFFQQLGVATRLSDYDLDEHAAEAVAEQLQAHNMIALGEHGRIDPATSRKILLERL